MYSIKETPEDFIVEEILKFDKIETGRFHIYKLTKKNLTTPYALDWISREYKILRKQIGFCGNKDKHAVTTQYITLPIKIGKVNSEELSLELVKDEKERLTLGAHDKNKFIIKVRNLSSKNYDKGEVFKNYFGPQRFSKHNFEIGLAILKNDHKKACSLIDEDKLIDFLQDHPKEYTNALKKVDVRFFVHAFQSKIFNEVLKEIDKEIEIPLPNFDLDTFTDIGKKVEAVMSKYDITKEDFVLRSFPECIQETAFRNSLIELEDFNILFEEEKGKYIATVEFVLPKGSYATVIIEKLFGKS